MTRDVGVPPKQNEFESFEQNVEYINHDINAHFVN